jgi:hypothetical protein
MSYGACCERVRRTSGVREAIAIPLLLWPFASACATDAPRVAEAVVRDSAGIAIVENPAALADRPFELRLSNEPVADIGVVDGAPEYQLFGVSSALPLADGRIVVVNAGTQELRFFDEAGTFINATGGSGEGPGEYRYPEVLRSPWPDSLIVYDNGHRRFSVLDTNGAFVRSITPNAYIGQVVGLLGNGRALSARSTAMAGPNSPEGMIPNRRIMSLMSLDAAREDTVGVFDGPDLFLWNRAGQIGFTAVPFDVSASGAAAGDRIWITPGRTPELREYDAAGTLLRIVRVLREPEPVTRELFDAYVEERVSRTDDPDQAAEIRRRYGHTPMRDAFPAYLRLIVSAESDVWAERYRSEPGLPATWTVFGADGRARGSITVPAGVGLRAVGDGRVVATRRDDLDVEHVVVWRLENTVESD